MKITIDTNELEDPIELRAAAKYLLELAGRAEAEEAESVGGYGEGTGPRYVQPVWTVPAPTCSASAPNPAASVAYPEPEGYVGPKSHVPAWPFPTDDDPAAPPETAAPEGKAVDARYYDTNKDFAVAPVTDLDSAGMPWDSRIHAATRTRVADGTWRQKRGVAAELLASVTKEHLATQAVPLAPPADEHPEAFVVAPGMYPSFCVSPVNVATVGPVGIPPPFAPSAEPLADPENTTPPSDGAATDAPPSDAPGMTFPALMAAITKAGISQMAVVAAVYAAGLPSVLSLASRPDMVPVIAAALGVS
jgi:hypothetical protein